MPSRIPVPVITPRHYQLPAFDYWDSPGPKRAVEVWSRRLGKDLTYMNIACMKMLDRKGLYVHFLPEAAHARRTLWDGFTNEGERLIDRAFPKELRADTNETEMKITLKTGGAWQLGGSDQYDRWIGANPIMIVFSEYAVANPRSWEIMRPILKLNGGDAAFISTTRGYNHLYDIYQIALREPNWRASHLTGIEAGVMTQADIDEEIRLGMPEELARQEYLVDWSAANVGAILGRYIEAAEKSGRVTADDRYDPGGAGLTVSSDLGFRDTTAWWFWQPQPGGFHMVDYVEGNGLDAEEWIEKLRDMWPIETLLLPHDARAKTFQSRHTVVSQFLASGLAKEVKVVPVTTKRDRINAARTILPRCTFDATACAQGLMALRDWSFKWDPDRKNYSREPDHNWASHGADAFTYGAQMLRDYIKPAKTADIIYAAPMDKRFTLDKMWDDNEPRRSYGPGRI